MKYLHLTLREPPKWRNPMHTFLMGHDEMHRAQLLNWNTNADEMDIILFRIVGARTPYTDALDDSPFVVGYETAPIDEESFYVYIEHETRDADDQFRDPFFERRVLAIPPIEYTADGETLVEIVGRSEDVQGAVDDIPPEIEVHIDEVGAYDRGLSMSPSVLTDRQRAAVRSAVEHGYYEVPRQGSVEDVAATLDCAPSTASNHLRKAEARLVEQVLPPG